MSLPKEWGPLESTRFDRTRLRSYFPRSGWGHFLKSELFGTRVPGSVTLRQRLKSLISGTESFVALPARKEQPNQIDTVAPLITALRCYGVDQWKIQYFLKLTLEVSNKQSLFGVPH